MKARILATTAIIALTSQAAFANEVWINQTGENGADTAGIATLNITQQAAGGNKIGTGSVTPSKFEGGMSSVTITQAGTGNTADIGYYGQNGSSSTFKAVFTGNTNDFNFTLGSAGDAMGNPAKSYDRVTYDLAVTGAGNTITDTFSNALESSTTALNYDGDIIGDSNTVTVDSSGDDIDNLTLKYSITGGAASAGNTLDINLGDAVSNRNVDFTLVGNANNYTLNAQGSTASATKQMVITHGGSDGTGVTAILDQYGNGNVLALDVLKNGSGSFTVNYSDSLYSSGSFGTPVSFSVDAVRADMNVTALGAGSFDVTQGSAGATVTGSFVVPNGGTHTITQ